MDDGHLDSMEDSGIDSDQKFSVNCVREQENDSSLLTQNNEPKDSKKSAKATELQKKLEKHREIARRAQAAVDQQPRRSALLSRNRLSVPAKESIPHSQDQQPLVAIMSDDSEEDEFNQPMLSKAAYKEITQQLIKDGYNLDLEPDDEDLDLIPPRPLNQRCVCCNIYPNCAIQ
ncbi:hypothetical protein ScPMuIL_017865 [Solemya velum]